MIPPILMRIRIRRIGLWLPVFLVWPILLVLWLLLLPFVLVWAVATGRLRRGWLMVLAPVVYRVICAMRGFQVDVRDDQNTVQISIW